MTYQFIKVLITDRSLIANPSVTNDINRRFKLTKSDMSSICAYCEIKALGSSDHMFPKSLGRGDIFMDWECNKCNNDFSKNESVLFQIFSIVLMRSLEGIERHSKNKKRTAPLKYPEIFQFDKEHKMKLGLQTNNLTNDIN